MKRVNIDRGKVIENGKSFDMKKKMFFFKIFKKKMQQMILTVHKRYFMKDPPSVLFQAYNRLFLRFSP